MKKKYRAFCVLPDNAKMPLHIECSPIFYPAALKWVLSDHGKHQLWKNTKNDIIVIDPDGRVVGKLFLESYRYRVESRAILAFAKDTLGVD